MFGSVIFLDTTPEHSPWEKHDIIMASLKLKAFSLKMVMLRELKMATKWETDFDKALISKIYQKALKVINS